MKYIRTINELYKSTYDSAARQLGYDHKEKQKRMISHAAQYGEDVKHDRIYPHRFTFGENSRPNEYFFIVDYDKDNSVKIDKRVENGRFGFDVKLMSNWGHEKKFSVCFHIHSRSRDKIVITSYQDRYQKFFYETKKPVNPFSNETEKIAETNARHMVKFIKEVIEDYKEDFIDLIVNAYGTDYRNAEIKWNIYASDFYAGK